MFQKLVFKFLLFFEKSVTFFSAKWLRAVKHRPKSKEVYLKQGVLPVLDHYYEPLINPGRDLKKGLEEKRSLPGIDFNVEAQLSLLKDLDYGEELKEIALFQDKANPHSYYYQNNSFGVGDAEIFYSLIRHFSPKQLIEIGSGFSSQMALKAVHKNSEQNEGNSCTITCIEPYEHEYLENLDVILIRKKVEDIGLSVFAKLEANDILFIDSSHVIRPQGDVLHEYMEILPILKPGVLIHIHDLFSPRDYPTDWVVNRSLLWNEQYLVEAFLSYNDSFEIVLANNMLAKDYVEAFSRVCPVFGENKTVSPGSLWLRRK